MKKLLSFIFVACLVLSCTEEKAKTSTPEKKIVTWAEQAEKFFYKALDEAVPHDWQTQPVISEPDVWCSNDSTKTYVKSFKMKYYNQFGGISNGRFLYVYVFDKEANVTRYNISETGFTYLLRSGNDDEWKYQDKAVSYCIVFGGSKF